MRRGGRVWIATSWGNVESRCCSFARRFSHLAIELWRGATRLWSEPASARMCSRASRRINQDVSDQNPEVRHATSEHHDRVLRGTSAVDADARGCMVGVAGRDERAGPWMFVDPKFASFAFQIVQPKLLRWRQGEEPPGRRHPIIEIVRRGRKAGGAVAQDASCNQWAATSVGQLRNRLVRRRCQQSSSRGRRTSCMKKYEVTASTFLDQIRFLGQRRRRLFQGLGKSDFTRGYWTMTGT